MGHQRTVQTVVSCKGIGLHTGQSVRMYLRPAPANSGVLFKRMDLPGAPAIEAYGGRVPRPTASVPSIPLKSPCFNAGVADGEGSSGRISGSPKARRRCVGHKAKPSPGQGHPLPLRGPVFPRHVGFPWQRIERPGGPSPRIRSKGRVSPWPAGLSREISRSSAYAALGSRPDPHPALVASRIWPRVVRRGLALAGQRAGPERRWALRTCSNAALPRNTLVCRASAPGTTTDPHKEDLSNGKSHSRKGHQRVSAE